MNIRNLCAHGKQPLKTWESILVLALAIIGGAPGAGECSRGHGREAPSPFRVSVSPSALYVGEQSAVTITGAGILPGAVLEVSKNGDAMSPVLATSVSSGRFTVASQAAYTTDQIGTYAFYVLDADGRRSDTLTLRVLQAQAPALAAVSPDQVLVGDQPEFTITGSGFMPGARIEGTRDDGNPINVAPTFVSDSRLTVAAPAPYAANDVGAYTFYVVNPDGQRSGNTLTATISSAPASVNPRLPNAAPVVVSGVSPATAYVGQQPTFTITGSGFTHGAVLEVSKDGGDVYALVPTFVSTGELTIAAAAPYTDADAGAYTFFVVDPSGEFSSELTVDVVRAAPPSLSTVSPLSAFVGQRPTWIITGSGFMPGAVLEVSKDGGAVSPVAPTRVSDGQLTIAPPAPYATADIGVYTFYVLNPDGRRSATLNATIVPPPAD